jgi:hypothetical protein
VARTCGGREIDNVHGRRPLRKSEGYQCRGLEWLVVVVSWVILVWDVLARLHIVPSIVNSTRLLAQFLFL